MKMIASFPMILAAVLITGCQKDPIIETEVVYETRQIHVDNPEDQVLSPFVAPGFEEGHANPVVTDGAAYLFDNGTAGIPSVYIKVSAEQWNKLLLAYDKNNRTNETVHADMSFVKGEEATVVRDVALSIKGNTSRRRPEGSSGSLHQSENPNWHHAHFGLSLNKYVEGNAIGGVRKLVLKWFKDDGNYVREMYSYDLFRRFGVWTGPEDVYAKVYIQVGKDLEPAYFGIYQMYEPYDQAYLDRRTDRFGAADGNLWECRYGGKLTPETLPGIKHIDEAGALYELNVTTGGFDKAKAQFTDFITNLNALEGSQFHDWIGSHMDVDLLLKTYAVNVGVGMWDDYWNNAGNNTFLYFNSQSATDYHVYLLPHDYDNTLGTTSAVGAQTDAVTHNPYEWGPTDVTQSPLVNKILAFDDYRAIYTKYLLELASEGGLLTYESSMQRIGKWQEMVAVYIANDTGEDMKLIDVPASWGNHPEYRVVEDGEKNFFRVKTASLLYWTAQ